MFVSCVLPYVGSDLCDNLMTHSGESCCVCVCVCVCVRERSRNLENTGLGPIRAVVPENRKVLLLKLG